MTEFLQHTIAIVYDFDGTLSPKPMQEYTVLPKIGIEASDFWAEVNRKFAQEQGEAMLTYMRLLLEKAEEKSVELRRGDFKDMADKIEYFPGVEDWFDRINSYVEEIGQGKVRVEHYVISAGLKEILEGTSIYEKFANVYASEYHYNRDGVPTFPKLLITDTSKTQFIFRINKGRQKLTESINQHMEWYDRPIPFQNMIYIGDGETDVPSMTVVQGGGGNAVAVYREIDEAGQPHKSVKICQELLEMKRVNFVAPADYSEGSPLETRTRVLLRAIISSISYEKEKFECLKENGLLREQR